MFDLNGFITTNIVNGVKNGTFTKEYANIMAVNYMLKGVLTEENVIFINTQIEVWEIEKEKMPEISVETLFDEIPAEEENLAENGTDEATVGNEEPIEEEEPVEPEEVEE